MIRMAIIRIIANGKFLNRYFMDLVLAIFSPCQQSEYPSGNCIFSISRAMASRACSVSNPGVGEHCTRRFLCPLYRGTTGSSHLTSIPLLICLSGVLPISFSTSSSLESVPAFNFTIVSSFNSPFKEGNDENTCALLKSSMG